jgi:hypothetical protein
MRRRDLLFGLGGLAGGSSLIVGSSGFTTVEAEREFNARIIDSDDGDEHPLGALITDERWTIRSYDIDTSAEDVLGSVFTARLGQDNGIAHINNSLPGEIETRLDAPPDHVRCRPFKSDDGTVSVEQGGQASFEAFVDCSELDDSDDIAEIIARINPDSEGALSADINEDVEIEFDTYVAIDVGPNGAIIDLATEHDQRGEHLNVELPLEITAFWTDEDLTDKQGETIELNSLSAFISPNELQASEVQYDKLRKIKFSDDTESSYKIENWFTHHESDAGDSWWEHHGTSEVQRL